MKKVINVNISGISFTFDDDAYEVLRGYLNSLDESYKGNPDGAEIIADIEARVAELILAEQPAAGRVVSRPLIDNIISRMGRPDQIEGDEDEKERQSEPKTSIPPRFYRNPENAKIAGVCSGMGAYFDSDPVWFRLGFFAPLLVLIITAPFGFGLLSGFLGSLFGSFVLLYLILWIAIPKARTPRQMLEMKGEKITASSIEKGFSGSANRSLSQNDSRNILAKVLTVFLQVILVILKGIFIFTAFIVGLSLVAGILTIVFFGAKASVFGMTVSNVDLGWVPFSLYSLSLFLVGMIPVCVTLWIILKALFSKSVNWKGILITIFVWLTLVVFTGAVTLQNIPKIKKAVIENFGYFDDFDDFDDFKNIKKINIKANADSGNGSEVNITIERNDSCRIHQRGESQAADDTINVNKGSASDVSTPAAPMTPAKPAHPSKETQGRR